MCSNLGHTTPQCVIDAVIVYKIIFIYYNKLYMLETNERNFLLLSLPSKYNHYLKNKINNSIKDSNTY